MFQAVVRRRRDGTSRYRVMIVVSLLLIAACTAYLVVPSLRLTMNGVGTATPTGLTQPAPSEENATWTTYHGDNSRSGVDSELSSFRSAGIAWRSAALDGAVYAQPLVAGGRVVVATENDSVYALGATNGTVLWRAHLGEPVRGTDLPCGDINPSGITGTPVLDPKSGTVFVTAFLEPPHHELYALDLSDGAVRFERAVDPLGADPNLQQQRGALALANGFVYVSYGGLFGDCGEYHGWVVGARADGSGALLSYMVPTGRAGGIWATSGPAVDGSGDLFVSTGNSFSQDSFDFGNSVIKLSPELGMLGYFSPSDWLLLNRADLDLGSVGPALLGGGEVFQIGKDGMGYLIDSAKPGGIGGERFASQVCEGAFGGTAYLPPLLFVPCTDGLTALSVDAGASPSFGVAWRGPPFDSGPPIVSGGAVWTVDTDAGLLYAFRVNDGSVLFRTDVGRVAHFTSPASGDGRVYVAAADRVVAIGLNP